jgi:hypothetical protein
MRRRLFFAAMGTLAGLATIAASTDRLIAERQSLADVANQGAQQRSSVTTPSKVYSNADVTLAPCEQDVSSRQDSKASEDHRSGLLDAPATSRLLAEPTREEIVRTTTQLS